MWTENGALKSGGPEVIITTLQKIELTKIQDIGVGISNALCDLLVKRAKKGQKTNYLLVPVPMSNIIRYH